MTSRSTSLVHALCPCLKCTKTRYRKTTSRCILSRLRLFSGSKWSWDSFRRERRSEVRPDSLTLHGKSQSSATYKAAVKASVYDTERYIGGTTEKMVGQNDRTTRERKNLCIH